MDKASHTEIFDTAIIGGGLAGLYAAYKCAKIGQSVCLIDKSTDIGGLMGSREFTDTEGNTHEFDFGIHYLLLTGIHEIDEEVTEFIEPDQWLWFKKSLPEGHVYNGILDEETGCINVSNAPHYDKILSEFFLTKSANKTFSLLSEKLEYDFGRTAHTELFQPLCHKLTGYNTNELAPEAYGVFGPDRLKLLQDADVVQKLKELPHFDRRLAHPKTKDGKSSMKKGYPKNGAGVGLWIRNLIVELKKLNVKFYLNSVVEGLNKHQGKMETFKITDLEVYQQNQRHHISCHQIISGLAPGLLGRLFNVNMPGNPPKRRHMILVHYVFDQPLNLAKNHWITVYDPSFETFRITLYDNISKKSDEKFHRLTVEILSDDSSTEKITSLKKIILNELKRLNLVQDNTSPIACFSDICPYAVPVLTPGWQETLAEQSRLLQMTIQNIIPVGLASGVHFGQVATLRSVHEALRSA